MTDASYYAPSHSPDACARCGREDELHCTGCGMYAHDSACDEDEDGYGNVCARCWAILSHVEHVISCPGGCPCAAYLTDADYD